MTGPLVSIISPIYNEEQHIAEMVDSALAQTYGNWELVLVDDGSTDGTVRIVENYVADDPRIRIYRTDHGGPRHAFNQAYAHSQGDIIVHCGGDDYMPSDSLERRVEAFARFPMEEKIACFAHIRMFWDDGSREHQVVPRGSLGSRSSPGYAMTRPLADLAFPVPEELVAEDPWVGEVANALADHVIHLEAISVNYRVHPGNFNPRHRTFESMSDSLFQHSKALQCLLETDRFSLTSEDRRRFSALWRAENKCHERKPLGVLLTKGLPLADRLALTAAASPTLTRIRTRFYPQLSGWRGR